MNKLNQTLSEVLDVEPIGSTELLPATPVTKVDDDADFARENIRTLIEKGNLAVDGILHVAKESEHPRAYEVAAALMKTMAETNKDLLELQKTKKVLQKEDPKAPQLEGPQNVTNNLFVGSTAELQKMIRDQQDGYIESNQN